MAKKPLGLPRVPPGPQHAFFKGLQDLVTSADDLPLKELGKIVNRSPQVMHRALLGPAIPSLELVKELVKALSELIGANPEEMEIRFRLLRSEALIDQRDRREVPGTSAPHDAAPPGGSGAPPAKNLSADPKTAEGDKHQNTQKETPKSAQADDQRRTFTALLVRLKDASGKTRDQLATDTGVTPSAVEKWLYGERMPTPKSLKKFIHALGAGEADSADLWRLHQDIQVQDD
ncbi:helix-turn-helix domain-containing protein (plasmid) [Nocardia sp. NBC_01503]|uniref:helix-turn-helix domain-containing protein n=1 Tax=Nocardia sp. NBC_01503 TaxID=2975997 RepID=UPI002E7AE9DE|nr:helix-turn-helix transcriptional regulator [Nocardia sp. NBC_01503]WTL36690.1 helix-turn-helix domain-containing protein [Nocardia sp. NBC_01503]WTL36757.1 helix-turn-helix domain-containing protein [Nocardia sp. NBC_01503]